MTRSIVFEIVFNNGHKYLCRTSTEAADVINKELGKFIKPISVDNYIYGRCEKPKELFTISKAPLHVYFRDEFERQYPHLMSRCSKTKSPYYHRIFDETKQALVSI